jgi:hypothetical protein
MSCPRAGWGPPCPVRFFACGYADGSYVLVSGIACVNKLGIHFEPDSVYRRVRVRCADRDLWASGGAAGFRCHGDGECCLQRASEFRADPGKRIAGAGPCIQVTATRPVILRARNATARGMVEDEDAIGRAESRRYSTCPIGQHSMPEKIRASPLSGFGPM